VGSFKSIFFAKMVGQDRQSSGTGRAMAGMALAVPIHNNDGRHHKNSVKKLQNSAIWPAMEGRFIKAQIRILYRMQTVFVFIEQALKTRIFCNRFNQMDLGCWSVYLNCSFIVTDLRYLFFFRISFPLRTICLQTKCIINKNKVKASDRYATHRENSICQTDVK
jgi:hypothetical protein